MTTSRAVGSDVQEAHVHSWRVGFVLVAVVGTLWHFVYDLSGGSWLVGLVAPVNESVWEHTKLVEQGGPAVATWLGTVLVVALLAAVALLTIAPPDLPVFQAP